MDLGLERAGFQCVGQVEIDEWCRQVLTKHWPEVPKAADIRGVTGEEFGAFDLLAGGYPCQPFSVAGARRGSDDPRHLWPEVLRIVRHIRPRLVLLENVAGHRTLGLGEVLAELAESGYDAEWDCIPAAAVGAPHERDRIFIVAHTDDTRRQQQRRTGTDQAEDVAPQRAGKDVPNANGEPKPDVRYQGGSERGATFASAAALDTLDSYRRTVGSEQWLSEPGVGRVVDGVPRRVDRLRGLGNAVVPQVAEFIGRRIMEVFT